MVVHSTGVHGLSPDHHPHKQSAHLLPRSSSLLLPSLIHPYPPLHRSPWTVSVVCSSSGTTDTDSPLTTLLDDIIQLIIYELNDPYNFTLASKRFLRVSRDPYVRANYFLHRYGHTDAMFWALGRGRILNDKVIDVRLFRPLVPIPCPTPNICAF